MALSHRLMRVRCQYCGRELRYGKIPNRGPVMVHGKGDGVACRRLIETGRDIVSQKAKEC